jgi:hypothetical protein
MKTYEANDQLIEILKKNDFIETSSEKDILKGKKKFKLSKTSRKSIFFDYINITIWEGAIGQESFYNLNENELRVVILYFKLKSADLLELTRGLQFNIKKSIERLNELKEEIEDWKELGQRKARIGKLERIIRIYNEVAI